MISTNGQRMNNVSENIPDSKVNRANMGSTWVLSAPIETHVGPMNISIRDAISIAKKRLCQNALKHHMISLDAGYAILDSVAKLLQDILSS